MRRSSPSVLRIAFAVCPSKAGGRDSGATNIKLKQDMKITSALLLSGFALGITSIAAIAQEASGGGRPSGGSGGGQSGRPGSPVMAALDANKDGELDETELANATAALKALDKNGDGKLSGDEIRPSRGDRGQGGGQGGGSGGKGGGQGGPGGRQGGGPGGGQRGGQ